MNTARRVFVAPILSIHGNSRHFEGITPFKQASVPPGEYRVTLQRADWRPVVKAVTVKRNEEVPLAADLHGIGLTITSNPPGAQVTLNGKEAGQTPLSLTDQAPGEYRVTFIREGYDTAERTITAENNTTVNMPLAKSIPKVGTLVVYRESHFIGLAGRPDLRINDQFVCELTAFEKPDRTKSAQEALERLMTIAQSGSTMIAGGRH